MIPYGFLFFNLPFQYLYHQDIMIIGWGIGIPNLFIFCAGNPTAFGGVLTTIPAPTKTALGSGTQGYPIMFGLIIGQLVDSPIFSSDVLKGSINIMRK